MIFKHFEHFNLSTIFGKKTTIKALKALNGTNSDYTLIYPLWSCLSLVSVTVSIKLNTTYVI